MPEHDGSFGGKALPGVNARPGRSVSRQSQASSASTSSLALLREKLAALPGCQFEREPVSVCALPQLSSVTEVTEIDESQSFNDESTLRLRTFGVTIKNKSDSDHATVTSRHTVSENNNLSPPNNNDEDSISCLLVATIGSADVSVINDTIDRFPKDKEINTDTSNIVDMLVKEALQSNRTVDRIRENTKNIRTESEEKAANVKNKAKESTIYEINENNNIVQHLGDQLNADYIEDTPNYVFPKHRKEVIISNKVISTEIEKSNKDIINNNKPALNPQVVEDFFTQHCGENKNDDVILSPSLAKKINETSSEASEEFDLPTNNDIERDFNFNEIDIFECLNDLVDQVCDELDNYINKQTYNQNTTMQNPTNDVEAGLQNDGADESDSKVTKKINSKKAINPKPIKLKFKTTMKRNKKQYKSKLQIETDANMSNVRDEDFNIKETDNNNKSKSPEITQVRRRRKLYSPKDEHIINAAKSTMYVSESEKDDIAPEQLPYRDTPKSKATSYKEIEQLKRSTRRLIKNSKMKNEPLLSPRSKKINEDFNNLKKTIDNNENITLVDAKRDKNLALYNFSSDSEDSDFKKKFTQTFKRTPTNTPVRRSRRNIPPKKYSEIETRGRKTKAKNKLRKIDTVKLSRDELVNEKMREPISETLNASVTIEVPKETPGNLEPNINIDPQMEVIDEQILEKCTKKSRSKRKTKQSKKKDQYLKSGNELVLEVGQEMEQSISPLPALIVESQPKDINLEDSVTALEKLQDMCEDESIGKRLELNTTQNLLSDLDQPNYSPEKLSTSNIEIIELDKSPSKHKKNKKRKSHNSSTGDKPSDVTNKDESLTKKKSKKNKKHRKREKKRSTSTDSNTVKDCVKILTVSAVIENESPKSIPTLGITGHGSSKENPPSSNQLDQSLQPRDLEVEYLDDSTKEYHKTLTNEMHKLWHSNNSERASRVSNEDVRRIVRNSPAVSIKRLSSQEIHEWMPPRHNSIFGSDQSDISKQSRVSKQSKKTKKETAATSTTEKKPMLSTISPIKLFPTNPISISDGGCVNMNRPETISSKTGIESKSKYDFRKRKNAIAVDSTPKKSRLASTATSSPIISSKPTTSKAKYRISEEVVPNVSQSSSVSNWMKQNQSILSSLPPENYETFMYRDNLNLIIEKLNTTLVEIQHDTSRRFSQLFVEIQRQLKEGSDTRHHLFRVTGCEMLDAILQIIDYKFKELDIRCRAMDDQVRNDFKAQTCAVLREDSKRKLQFVKLLKQDIRNMMPSE
ncbi:unnamed protein product [Colias eurytheme]|nr:unnamed protein product [Colias eurytheme]